MRGKRVYPAAHGALFEIGLSWGYRVFRRQKIVGDMVGLKVPADGGGAGVDTGWGGEYNLKSKI